MIAGRAVRNWLVKRQKQNAGKIRSLWYLFIKTLGKNLSPRKITKPHFVSITQYIVFYLQTLQIMQKGNKNNSLKKHSKHQNQIYISYRSQILEYSHRKFKATTISILRLLIEKGNSVEKHMDN